MFENAGKKVKDIAIVCFILEIIVVVVLGWKVANSGYEFEFGTFLIIGGVGFVVSYLSVIMTIAFGELVENSTTIVKYLEKTALKEENHSKEESIFKDTVKPVVDAAPSSNSTAKRSAISGFWVCPKCGRQNHNTVGTCGCGQDKNA